MNVDLLLQRKDMRRNGILAQLMQTKQQVVKVAKG